MCTFPPPHGAQTDPKLATGRTAELTGTALPGRVLGAAVFVRVPPGEGDREGLFRYLVGGVGFRRDLRAQGLHARLQHRSVPARATAQSFCVTAPFLPILATK